MCINVYISLRFPLSLSLNEAVPQNCSTDSYRFIKWLLRAVTGPVISIRLQSTPTLSVNKPAMKSLTHVQGGNNSTRMRRLVSKAKPILLTWTPN